MINKSSHQKELIKIDDYDINQKIINFNNKKLNNNNKNNNGKEIISKINKNNNNNEAIRTKVKMLKRISRKKTDF